MKKLINNVKVTGVLVSKNVKETTYTSKSNGDEVEAIGGSLVLRTQDGSEHEVNIFANRYKKDADGNATSEESKLFKAYQTIADEYVDMEVSKETNSTPDVISIRDGEFSVNDYKNKDGDVKSYNKLSSKFQNRVEAKDLDTTPQVAKFEVEGIVESISDEVIKDVPTGNLIIKFNIIIQRADGFGKDAKYEADSLIPIKLTVKSDIASAFREAGYYEGCFAKFVGTPINKTVEETIVEKQAFGADNIKIVKTTEIGYIVESGSTPSTVYEHELTDDIIQQLISKRKKKLDDVKNGFVKTDSDTTPFAKTENESTSKPNPFAKSNPFAK